MKIKSNHYPTILITALGLTSASVSHAATIAIDVSADTYISSNTGNNNGDTDEEIIVGTVNVGGVGPTDYRGLIRFDLTSLAILAGVGETITINSVDLLASTRSGDGGQGSGPIAINANLYNFGFVESTATWSDPAGAGADVAGGTLGTLLASASVADPTATATAVDFTSVAAFSTAVGSSLSGDNTLNLIVNRAGALAGANDFVRFGDEDRAGQQFRLDIDYTISAIPEPSSTALLGLGGLAFILRRRR